MTIYANPIVYSFNSPVQTLWEKLLPRLDLARNSINFVDSCNEVIEIITDRLWFRRSDILRYDVSFNVVQSDPTLTLPAEFLAIAAPPYLIDSNNKTILLTNLHDSRRYDYIDTESKPSFYDLNFGTVTIYPIPDASYTVVIPCYVKPTTVSDMEDDLPFNGIFNQLIGDNAVKISNVGLGLLADGTFTASIQEKIDKMINMRNSKTIYFKQTNTGMQHAYNNAGFNSTNYF